MSPGISTALRPASSTRRCVSSASSCFVQIGDQDVRAFARVGERDRSADAAVAAGDDGILAAQPSGTLIGGLAMVGDRLHLRGQARHGLLLLGKRWLRIAGRCARLQCTHSTRWNRKRRAIITMPAKSDRSIASFLLSEFLRRAHNVGGEGMVPGTVLPAGRTNAARRPPSDLRRSVWAHAAQKGLHPEMELYRPLPD